MSLDVKNRKWENKNINQVGMICKEKVRVFNISDKGKREKEER